MKSFILLIVWVFVTSSIGKIEAKTLPLKSFAKSATYKMLKMSPDGRHFAALSITKDRTVLSVFKRILGGGIEIKKVYNLGSGYHISLFYWLNNKRIVFQFLEVSPTSRQKISRGEVMTLHIDKNLVTPIFGYRAGSVLSTTRIKQVKPLQAFAEIIALLPLEPDYFLVKSDNWKKSQEGGSQVYKINATNGKRKLVTQTPYQRMSVIYHMDGTPILAKGTNWRGEKNSFVFKGDKWKKITGKIYLEDYSLVSASSDKNTVYLSAYNDDVRSLWRYNLITNEKEKVYSDKVFDYERTIRDPLTDEVIGVKSFKNKISHYFFETNNSFAKLNQRLLKAFKGNDVSILSSTKNGEEVLILVQNDKNLGDYYVFNTKKQNAQYQMSLKQWIDPEQMSNKKPIHFSARDNTTIYGYLTLPKFFDAKSGEKPSLVVYVHGGPYGVQDDWYYDDDVQMLANNGYAVLQINYRGSGGYGRRYETQAYKKRSSLIQDDIIDGTRWALSQQEIDNENVCIMGWSFGGYSALMAPLRDNTLYKCAIAAAGVYDAIEQENDADYALVGSLNAELEQVYGSDKKLLKKESPLTYIDQLKTPLLIVHGKKDKRVPVEQAYLLEEALKKRNMPFEMLIKNGEGHGFFDEDNRIEFYQTAIKFLNKHIGKK